MSEQIATIERKFNERSWVLRNLRRSGFTSADLLTVYKSLIRPVFDFTSVVYHSLLTIEQKQLLERLQHRAVSVIVGGRGGNYSKQLESLGLDTLDDRRLQLVDKFLEKSLQHPLFSEKWFPKKPRNAYNTRHEEM